MSRGFTLLEVLVALTILGLAIVTLLQLSSQGLRLLSVEEKVSWGHPQTPGKGLRPLHIGFLPSRRLTGHVNL